MKATKHELAGASAVSPYEPTHFAQAVEWPNRGGCWLQVGMREPIMLAWGEARAVVEVLQALLEEDDE